MKQNNPSSASPSFSDLIKARTPSALRSMTAAGLAPGDEPDWKTETLIPRKRLSHGQPNVLRAIADAADKYTDIPLGLFVFALFGLVSGWLVSKGAKWKRAGQTKTEGLGLWLVNLAAQGAGKSLSAEIIEENSPPLGVEKIGRCKSGAAFIRELSQKPKAYYLLDEAAPTMEGMGAKVGPLSDLEEYLLVAFNGKTVEKSLAKEKDTVRVENPELAINWISTTKNFSEAVSEKQMNTGILRRFLFAFSQKDDNKSTADFTEYDLEAIGNAIRPGLHRLFSRPVDGEVFTITPAAYAAYETAFKKWAEKGVGVCLDRLGFFRTVMRSAFRYAPIFHLIFDKPGTDIDAEDMDAALAVVVVHLFSILKLVNDKTGGSIDPEAERLKRALARTRRAVVNAARRKKPRLPTAREIQRMLGNGTSADDARALIETVATKPESIH